MNKRRWVTYGLLSGVLVLTAWAASAMPRKGKTFVPSPDPVPVKIPTLPQTVQIPKAPPRVEIVFALDTTGSMSSLIDGAKRKIWSIAQFIANGQPRPDVRIGLVAYRDVGDEYVTRFYDLSGDLDEVFEHLSSFEAGGGGDTPEHVAKALADAVERTSWTQDQGTLKQIYLVGAAPPHTDYNDGLDYRKLAARANRLGIHINTVRCGSDRQTELAWNEISNAASGEYASIGQDGGMRIAATPYDTKLAALNAKLVGTAMGYGAGRGVIERRAKAAMAAPPPMAADRASFYGAKGGAVGGADTELLSAVEGGKIDVAAAPAATLPAEVAALAPAKREEFVKAKVAERSRIQAEINDLAKQRNAWMEKNVAAKPDSFDAKVRGSLKKQAKSIGLAF
jgi:Mg-chelatase subunit ChlD